MNQVKLIVPIDWWATTFNLFGGMTALHMVVKCSRRMHEY